MAQTIKGLPKNLKKVNTFKIAYYTDSYKDVTIKDKGQTIVLSGNYDRNDVYRVETDINKIPSGYVIWNIGRHNFPIESYIPLCITEEFTVDTKTLVALKVPSEKIAQDILDKSMHNTMTIEDVRNYLTR